MQILFYTGDALSFEVGMVMPSGYHPPHFGKTLQYQSRSKVVLLSAMSLAVQQVA